MDGQDGDDTFNIDASNGAISVPGGISIAEGIGNNTVQIDKSPAAGITVTADSKVVPGGAGAGSHRLTIVDTFGQQGTQLVSWAQVANPTDTVVLAQNVDVLGA